MLKIIKPILITLLSIFLLGLFIPSIRYGGWTTLILASVVLTLLQKIVRPILNLLLLPINIVTLGFFSLVINVIILWLAMVIVPGFHIDQVSLFGIQFAPFFGLLFVSFALGMTQSAIDAII